MARLLSRKPEPYNRGIDMAAIPKTLNIKHKTLPRIKKAQLTKISQSLAVPTTKFYQNFQGKQILDTK